MTRGTSLLPWQKSHWELLCKYLRYDRIPQALLITGAAGSGKHLLAGQFASALLCSNRTNDGVSCGNCRSCLLIKSDTHPDLFNIQPGDDKTTISVTQIRSIISDTCLKPQFGGYRIIIIAPADAMTLAAANAFLKCLEEPAERTVFLLLTNKATKLPATIISRCQRIVISLADRMSVQAYIESKNASENTGTLANLLMSSIIDTHQLGNNAMLKQRSECYEDWLSIAKSTAHPVLVSEKWLKIQETTLMNWLVSWVTDLIKCVFNLNNPGLINTDMLCSLQDIARNLSLKPLFELYDLLIASRQRIDTQVNYQLMLEEILVKWQQINARY